MFEKLKRTVKALIDNLTPVEYGIANLSAMLAVPVTLIIRALFRI